MKNKIDMARYLLVFNQILSYGQKTEDRYSYHDMEAWHDFDGYTCFLSYDNVTLTLYFHGHYQLDYINNKSLSAFKNKVELEYKHR